MSHLAGSWAILRQTVSRFFSSNLISGYFSAVSRQHLRNSPSDIRITFALCTAVTVRRPFDLAYSNAYSATRLRTFD